MEMGEIKNVCESTGGPEGRVGIRHCLWSICWGSWDLSVAMCVVLNFLVLNSAVLIPSNTFHILRPTKAPGFVYAWLELISHRIFIARMLAHTPQQKVRLLPKCSYMLTAFLRSVPFTSFPFHCRVGLCMPSC